MMEEKGLKILLVSSLPPPVGGIETWSRVYLEWAKANHVSADIVDTALVGYRAKHPGVRRRLFDEIRRTKTIFLALYGKVSNFQPDIVHLNSSCEKFGIVRDYLCAVMVRRRGIPLVVHYRCNLGDRIGARTVQMHFFRRLSGLANQTLVLNASSENYMRDVTGLGSQRVANFVDASFITERPKPISTKVRRVLYVGRVEPQKGSREVLDAARSLPGIDFILAGPVSAEMSSLTIPDNVSLPGSVGHDRVRQLLDTADIFVFPSYTEGFSNALAEAMARGMPIIATPVGANVEMIEESGGILVRVGSASDIVGAIGRMGPSGVRESMSLWNMRKAGTSYTVDGVMRRLLRIYGEVVAKRQG